MPKPTPDEKREDYMARCAAAGHTDKECQVFWEEVHPPDAARADPAQMRRPMSAQPAWLRAGLAKARPASVDRDKGIIRGYTVAQLGPFKSGRGEFDPDSLKQIAAKMNAAPQGVKSRFTHPSLSGDGLGKHLGRARDARVEGDKVRADLHLSPTSRNTPSGDLGGYVMDLAEQDPGAFGSSLVLKPREEHRLTSKGAALLGPDGKPLPPLWYPEEIHASDVVDDGDAVHDGFLSVPGELRVLLLQGSLPDDFVRTGSALLDSVFAGQSREVVEARVRAWLDRYLSLRYGPTAPTPRLDERRRRLAELDALATMIEVVDPARTGRSSRGK